MKKEILCLGDSNTHGYNAENGGRFPYDVRWPGVLAKLLGDDYHIIEEGLSGRTSVFEDPVHEGMNTLPMLSAILMTHEPLDTLIIMLGTNDTKERFGASAPIIGIGLDRLIRKALSVCAWKDNPDIIIVCPAPIQEGYYEKTCGPAMGVGCSAKSFGLAKEYLAVANKLNCRFLDAGPIATVHPNDWMHLTPEGHTHLALALSEMVLK